MRVYYETQEVDLVALAQKEGHTVLGYYLTPVPGRLLVPNVGTPYPIQDTDNPLEVRSEAWSQLEIRRHIYIAIISKVNSSISTYPLLLFA